MEVPQDPPVGGDRDRSPALTIMVIVVMSMTIPVVSLRMVTRKFLTRNVGWDDWTIVLAEVNPFFSTCSFKISCINSMVDWLNHRSSNRYT